MFPLELGGQKIPWSHPLIFILLGAGIITGFLFVKAERRAVEPVFPLELFKERDFMISFMVMAMQLAAQGSMMFTVPLYFQVTSAVSATTAGAHLLPAVLGNTVSQLISGWSIGKFGRYKIQITLGTAFTSICYVLMLLRWNGHTNFWESLYIIPGGFGTGVAASALFIAMTASVAPSMVAIAASSMYLSATVGSLVGLAVAVGPDVENRDEIIRRCLQDIEYVQGLEGNLKDSVIRMYLKGFDGVYSES
ncbi:Multidrug resistance protein [Neofusicoccum parvum]|uniref:Multidrug resistance protein n=1 Tax=Neofusicoccum parvum TaxID=310453 RepID=A0ACB5SJX8_9PEZI|nr:Multidrug resistance protein [Neofusicoccum parvum]GME45043.1 Multidrug resistance protein [Neofusicoccum parvum]